MLARVGSRSSAARGALKNLFSLHAEWIHRSLTLEARASLIESKHIFHPLEIFRQKIFLPRAESLTIKISRRISADLSDKKISPPLPLRGAFDSLASTATIGSFG
jgi:hypothetical protein